MDDFGNQALSVNGLCHEFEFRVIAPRTAIVW
jgi:hypothetical protein